MATRKKKSAGRGRKQEPWQHDAPADAHHTKLSPAKRASARRSAKRAGRSYPNLVDNMRAARGKSTKKKAAKKKSASKKK